MTGTGAVMAQAAALPLPGAGKSGSGGADEAAEFLAFFARFGGEGEGGILSTEQRHQRPEAGESGTPADAGTGAPGGADASPAPRRVDYASVTVLQGGLWPAAGAVAWGLPALDMEPGAMETAPVEAEGTPAADGPRGGKGHREPDDGAPPVTSPGGMEIAGAAAAVMQPVLPQDSAPGPQKAAVPETGAEAPVHGVLASLLSTEAEAVPADRQPLPPAQGAAGETEPPRSGTPHEPHAADADAPPVASDEPSRAEPAPPPGEGAGSTMAYAPPARAVQVAAAAASGTGAAYTAAPAGRPALPRARVRETATVGGMAEENKAATAAPPDEGEGAAAIIMSAPQGPWSADPGYMPPSGGAMQASTPPAAERKKPPLTVRMAEAPVDGSGGGTPDVTKPDAFLSAGTASEHGASASRPPITDVPRPDAPSSATFAAGDPGITAVATPDGPAHDPGAADEREAARHASIIATANPAAVRHETYLAPVTPLPSPARQIAERIIAGLAADAPPPARQTGAADEGARPPLKVLHIRLNPPELGPLTIRMTMRNGALGLHMEAGNQETARLIDSGREAISSALRGAGYTVDGLTVQSGAAARPDQAVPFGGTGAGAQPQGQPAQGWHQPGGHNPGQPGQNGRGGYGATAETSDETREESGTRRIGGALYL